MDTADPSKTTNPGQEGFHGVHLCRRCGWPFPKPIPSARHRRQHKRICGTVPGYTLVHNDSTLQTQYSALSSFSDDEHCSDGDSNPPSVKSVKTVNESCSGRTLERMNMSADDVFTDAVSEFTDTNASLGGDEGLSIDTDTVNHNGFAIPDSTPPVDDVTALGGNGQAQALINHETAKGTATSPNREKVSSFSEIEDIVEDSVTEVCEENKFSDAVEGSDGLETGARKTDDAFEYNAVPVIVPVRNDSGKTVTEEMHTLVESEIGQNEEKHDVESDSKTFMDDHFQEGKSLLHSSDEISCVPVKDIPLLTEKAAEGSDSTSPEAVHGRSILLSDKDALVSNQVIESGSEIEEDISSSLLVDAGGEVPNAAEIRTPETSLVLTGPGNGSENSNEKDLISLTRASAIDDTGTTTTTDKIVGSSSIVDPEDGSNKMGIVAEDFLVKVQGNVSENETTSDNLSSNVSSSEGPVRISPVVLIQSAGAASEIESLHAERAVQLPSDVNSSSGDKFTGNAAVIGKEVKLDDEDPASELKQVSHNVLLQKLEEDLSDDEPEESFPATESSSQSLGINQVDDVSKGTAQSLVPEKTAAVSVTDPSNEINSPNGSSLDGNWGSISVLSTMSDAAGDVKKLKDPQEGQSSDKHELFDPPSFLTLIEPQAQKSAVTSSTSSEGQNPQQLDATKAAWFPSITNVQNDSSGRKKNEEIIAKVTNWSTSKQHSPLKTLLVEAKANSPNSNSSDTEPKDITSEKKGGKAVSDSSGKEWSAGGGEKRKEKGKAKWVPFMCCSSVK